ncbi:MAG: 3-amino-4-hydroxybenzoic acid synthase [Aliidongia sp.]|nr:3-amino-4-hydroxybenzoic acid synthase [Aliidongia sp.]
MRAFSDDAEPHNFTELRPGDRVLGFGTEPGRHVGVNVDERLIELGPSNTGRICRAPTHSNRED